MLIMLLLLFIILLCISILIFRSKCYHLSLKALTNKNKKLHFKLNKFYHSDLLIIKLILLITSFVLIVLSCLIIGIQTNSQIEFEQSLYEKKTLEYRLEHINDNKVGNEMLYSEIIDFNNNLRYNKYWVNNYWTNWFNNSKVAKLGYIEYEFAED